MIKRLAAAFAVLLLTGTAAMAAEYNVKLTWTQPGFEEPIPEGYIWQWTINWRLNGEVQKSHYPQRTPELATTVTANGGDRYEVRVRGCYRDSVARKSICSAYGDWVSAEFPKLIPDTPRVPVDLKIEL